MARFAVPFFELHTPLFSQGVNFGLKITPAQRQAKAYFDSELDKLIFIYRGKVTLISAATFASIDIEDPSELSLDDCVQESKHAPTPAIAKRRKAEVMLEYPPEITTDPHDPAQAEAHRQAVRAASANAYKTTPILETQNDQLIQQSRIAAAAAKTHGDTLARAQVENPTMPTVGMTGIQGKPKARSHAQLKAQVAKEAKDVTGTQ